MKVNELIQYVIGIMLLGAIAGALLNLILNFIPIVVAISFICIPLYGIYRTKNGKKGLTQILKISQTKVKKVVARKKKDYTTLFIMGIAISLVLGEVVLSIVKVLVFTAIGLFAVATLWEATRLAIKVIAKKNILSFVDAVGLSL